MEHWMPVLEYEGLYEVSSEGRVRSVDRVVVKNNGVKQPRKGRLLRPSRNPDGYLHVNLCKEGKGRTLGVHRLVALAFLPKPEGSNEVRHLDGSRNNSQVANLAWGTHSDNMQDRLRHGRHNLAIKTHCPKNHPYSGDNLKTTTSGARVCRTCANAASVAWYAKKRALKRLAKLYSFR